jgi:cold shock CspA family protein
VETPARIDFVGFTPATTVTEEIERHLAMLEQRFGRITSCHIAIKAPGHHHLTGGLYQVEIRLALPGHKEVNVGRTRQNDERLADIHFALNHAFKRARRQLQDRVRQLEGSVKQHHPQPTGTIARLDPSGDYGFIAADDGTEVYFHKNSVVNAPFSRLRPGMAVSYAEEAGEKGMQASTVHLLGGRRSA